MNHGNALTDIPEGELPRKWRRAELVAEVRLLAYSDSIDSIAARLGIKASTLERRLQRAGERALLARITPLPLDPARQERAA